jgi:hypothetical protein
MIKEALLVGFEGCACSGFGVAIIGLAALAGDVGGLQRRWIELIDCLGV